MDDSLIRWFHQELGENCRHEEGVNSSCENWALQFMRTGPRSLERGEVENLLNQKLEDWQWVRIQNYTIYYREASAPMVRGE
jgi:hypothetical protein